MALARYIAGATHQVEKEKTLKRPKYIRNSTRIWLHAVLTVFVVLLLSNNSVRLCVVLWCLLFEGLAFLVPLVGQLVNAWPVSSVVGFACLQLILSAIAENVIAGRHQSLFKNVRLPVIGFPMGRSGDPRVVVGPRGVVSVNANLEVASFFDQSARATQRKGQFVTGDDVSVIIVARNEDKYLAKTIQFLYDTTPTDMLKEVVVVDDCSDAKVSELLAKELPRHVAKIVVIKRFDKCEGLIRARIIGADTATASNIFFMDGHCRPKPNWWPPLLKHLKTNYKRLACPIIHDVDGETWTDKGTSGAKMMFEWTFEFGWYDDLTDEVPLSAGGVVALTKKWWEESGKYDPGMLEWGGENIEQSVRVWLCGGEIFVARESHVGHVFNRPPKPNPGNKLVEQVQKNQKRAALVWLDDYYDTFQNQHSVVKSLDEGPNLAERFALRKKLGCRPFQWYVDKFRTSFERKGNLLEHFHHLRHVRSKLCLTMVETNPGSADPNREKFRLTLADCNPLSPLQKWQTISGNRMLYVQQHLLCLDSWSGSGMHYPVMRNCNREEVFKAKLRWQFWQVDDVQTGHVFSYPDKNHQTLTGNDFYPVNVEAAVSPQSTCLTSDLPFWTAMQQTRLLTWKPELVTFAPCAEPKRRKDWLDPQAWERLW